MRGMTNTLTLGERVAWYRRRRGMSQEVLAGLIDRTADWLSRVENNRISSRAYSSSNRRDEAVATLLDAEQVAPEQVRYHYLSRHLVQTWIRSTKSKPSHQLAALARRLEVA